MPPASGAPPGETRNGRPQDAHPAPATSYNLNLNTMVARDADERRLIAAPQAARGWSLFPCGTPTGGSHGHKPGQGSIVDCATCKAEKAPRRGWRWKERNSADPAVILEHWPADEPNIGIATEPSGLVVLDCDTDKHGTGMPDGWQIPGIHNGLDAFAHLLEQHGEGWPQTYIVGTASGGLQFYFQAIDGRPIRNSASKVAPMIDVRGVGGYVVAAGSVVGGKAYEVIDDSDPAPLPGWLADLADPPAPVRPASRVSPATTGVPVHSRFVALLDVVLDARVGGRNAALFWAASRAAEMVRDGLVDPQAAMSALTQAGEAIGLGDREVQGTINSAFRAAA